MPSTERRDNIEDPSLVLRNVIETRRKAQRISLRLAAARAGMAEATWRQLVAGGVNAGGRWVTRTARRDQVLAMAHAVGALPDVAARLDATPDEVADTERNVILTDPAEEEILALRHLRPVEKLRLIEALNRLRDEG